MIIQTSASAQEKKKFIKGYDGGMMVHTGYVTNSVSPLSYYAEGPTFGIGGLIKLRFSDHFRNGFEELKSYLKNEPNDLKEYLLNVVPSDLMNLFDVENFGWVNLMFCDESEKRGLCNIVIDKYNDDLKDLKRVLKESLEDATNKGKNNLLYYAAKIQKSINTIKDQRIIEFLSKTFKVPKTNIEILKGETSKDKTLFLKIIDEEKRNNIIIRLTK